LSGLIQKENGVLKTIHVKKADIEGILESIKTLLSMNLEDIDQAYTLAEDTLKLSLNIGIDVAPEGTARQIAVKLSFIRGVKITDSQKIIVNDKQMELPEDK